MRLERYALRAILIVSAGLATAGVIFDNNDYQITVSQVAGQTVINYPEWQNVVAHDESRTLEFAGGIMAVGAAGFAVRRRLK